MPAKAAQQGTNQRSRTFRGSRMRNDRSGEGREGMTGLPVRHRRHAKTPRGQWSIDRMAGHNGRTVSDLPRHGTVEENALLRRTDPPGDPDAGASAGRHRFAGLRVRELKRRAPSSPWDHASVRVGPVAIPAPFALADPPSATRLSSKPEVPPGRAIRGSIVAKVGQADTNSQLLGGIRPPWTGHHCTAPYAMIA